ncbi:MAG: D-alanyl-lipoteichoic acid biosynthesis protein DltD [Flavobacteriales bacterium]
MTVPPHSGWRTHAIGLALAAAIAIPAGLWIGERSGCGCAFPTPLRSPLRGYLDTYKAHPHLASALAHTLEDGTSLVLLGSSELTTADHPSKPVNFFNQRLGIPLLALGHAGNQSFSIHAQLIAADVDLRKARLAILVSPSWFVDRSALTGTELAAFLDYQPSPSLYRIHRRIRRGDTLALPVGRYLAEHLDELGAAQPIALWLARNGSLSGRLRYAFSQPWNAAIIRLTEERMDVDLRPPPEPLAAPEDTVAPDRQALYAAAEAEHRSQCTNNRVFVNDAYYAEHVQGRTRRLDVHAEADNRELRDFRALLDFLHTSHAEPLFILQPLNPYVYENLPEADATMDAIRSAIQAHGFDLFDLWTSDTAAFRPGTLTDVMHLGPLGWYRVDSALNAYYHEAR